MRVGQVLGLWVGTTLLYQLHSVDIIISDYKFGDFVDKMQKYEGKKMTGSEPDQRVRC